jgi:hypothetical protein
MPSWHAQGQPYFVPQALQVETFHPLRTQNRYTAPSNLPLHVYVRCEKNI